VCDGVPVAGPQRLAQRGQILERFDADTVVGRHVRIPDLVEVDSREFYGEGYEDSDRRIPDITKTQTLLGWRPKYGLEETLEILQDGELLESLRTSRRQAAAGDTVPMRDQL